MRLTLWAPDIGPGEEGVEGDEADNGASLVPQPAMKKIIRMSAAKAVKDRA